MHWLTCLVDFQRECQGSTTSVCSGIDSFYGIKVEIRNSIQHLYDDDKVMFRELLLKTRRNEDEEVFAKVTSKALSVESEVKNDLEEKVNKLLAVAKSGQMEKGKDKQDRSRTLKLTPTNSGQNTPKKRDGE